MVLLVEQIERFCISWTQESAAARCLRSQAGARTRRFSYYQDGTLRRTDPTITIPIIASI